MKQDPLALAFFGAALAVLAGLLVYVFFFKTPEPATPVRAFDFLREKFRQKPAAPAPAAPSASATGIQAGHNWRYTVTVEPPAWRDITLTYRTQKEAGGLAVLTDFVHAGGRMNFHLGIYAPGHPTHANVRFPGFFMHPSYFPQPLQPGQAFSWSWPWQPQRAGRMKRYDARVLRWEDVTVPAGTFKAAVIEADLIYVEGGQVRGRAKETLWYAPQVAQLVKVVRDGRTPDEGLDRIVAELKEYR